MISGNDWRWVETFDAAGFASPRSKAFTYRPAFTIDNSGGPNMCAQMSASGSFTDVL
jgi:hypothetical protein